MDENQRLNVLKALRHLVLHVHSIELTPGERQRASAALTYCIELLDAELVVPGTVRRHAHAVTRVRLRRSRRDGFVEHVDDVGDFGEPQEETDGEA